MRPSAGRSIAVQEFNENLGVMVTLAVYAGLLKAGVDVRSLMSVLGVMAVLAVSALFWREQAAAARRARA